MAYTGSLLRISKGYSQDIAWVLFLSGLSREESLELN